VAKRGHGRSALTATAVAIPVTVVLAFVLTATHLTWVTIGDR